MMFGRGYYGLNRCFGYGSGIMNNGMGFIMMIAFILLLTVVVIFLVNRNKKSKSGNAALDALKLSLAKGEISEDEYTKRKNLIDL